MFINLHPSQDTPTPGLLEAAQGHLLSAIGPLRFRVVQPGNRAVLVQRGQVENPAIRRGLVLHVGSVGPDWEPWQTTAIEYSRPNEAVIAVRSMDDWFPTRGSWVLAWTALHATLRLLLGPGNEPHPLPKTCLNHAEPTDRVGAFALIRGGYICQGCCKALQARGVDPFSIDQMQEATQLVRGGLILPHHYRPQPGRLRLVEQQGRLVAELPDYGPGGRLLEPLQLAVYLLFLRHPKGLATSRPPGLTQTLAIQLATLYRWANPNMTVMKAHEKTLAALKPARLSELVSFINTELASRTPSAVASEYQILSQTCIQTGQRVRRIRLARHLVEDLPGALSF